MRIVRVIAKLEPGGAQLAALRITQALAGHSVSTQFLAGEASPEGSALFARAGVEVEVYGRERGLQSATSHPFAAWLAPRLAGAEIVHAHMAGAWWAAATALMDARDVVLVASEHNLPVWLGRRPDASLRRALVRVDHFFAHGAPAREATLDLGLPAEALSEGRSPVAGLDSAPKAGLPRPRIVFSGRLHPEKGPDVLLDALALLPRPPQTIVLGDGPLAASLREGTLTHGLEHAVCFAGWVDEPGAYVAGADLQVVPSRDDAWSQSAVLAMGLGVPVIGTSVPGLSDTLGMGRGRTVPPGDPAALAAAIARVLSGDRPDPAPGLAYAQRFTVELVADYYLEAYARLLARVVVASGGHARA